MGYDCAAIMYTKGKENEMNVINNEVLNIIRREYGLASVEVATYFEGYGSKYVALLNTNEGSFVLKAVDYKQRNIFIINERLKKYEYPHMFHIKRTTSDSQFAEIDDNIYYVYPFIKGESFSDNAAIYPRIGEALAKLHCIEIDGNLPVWNLNSLISDIDNDRIPYIPREYQSVLKECTRHFEGVNSLPKGIIHGDVGQSNGIIGEDNSFVLIDWDSSGVAPRIIDLAYPLFGLLSDELMFQWEAAAQLLKAYTNIIELTNLEKKYFVYAVLLLPCNYILMGNIEIRINKIKWFLQNEKDIVALLDK